MILLIFKRIFIQRKQNRWVVLSCFVISLLLFSVIIIGRDFYSLFLNSPKGVEADVENTYVVELIPATSTNNQKATSEQSIDALNQIKLKLQESNSIEHIATSTNYFSMLFLNPIDSTKKLRGVITNTMVDYNFFRIFKPKIITGLDNFKSNEFEKLWSTQSKVKPMVISSEVVDMVYYIEKYGARGAEYKSHRDYNTIVGDNISDENFNEFNLISISESISITPNKARTVYTPLYESDLADKSIQLYVKVKSGSKFNVNRFEVWPYLVKRATSLEKIVENNQLGKNAGVFMMIILIIGFFLFYLISGILGSFWLRTIQRTDNIGLQLALGATPLRIAWEMFVEAIALLLIAFIPAMIIAANQYYFGIMTMPVGDAAKSAITTGMFVENMLYTLLTMATMVVIGIAAPLFKAIRINPSRALMSK